MNQLQKDEEQIILSIDTSNLSDEQANDLLKKIKNIVHKN